MIGAPGKTSVRFDLVDVGYRVTFDEFDVAVSAARLSGATFWVERIDPE